jgi:HEPN domain-containing protein
MTKLRCSNGDDHPDAALKHLVDAQVLFGQARYDGAAYHSGYVVECALKSLWLLEQGTASSRMPWGGNGHKLPLLASKVAALASIANAKVAPYLKTATIGLNSTVIISWNPEMRYKSPTMSLKDAQAWFDIADEVFKETVAQMRLDGVL